jgi:hypothetical protein
MNLVGLKNILKEINEPNEFTLQPLDLQDPLYWVFYVQRVRIKSLNSNLNKLRFEEARFDVFINGLFIIHDDFLVENDENNFVVKFIRNKFPILDRFENPYILDETDIVKVKGDLESF